MEISSFELLDEGSNASGHAGLPWSARSGEPNARPVGKIFRPSNVVEFQIFTNMNGERENYSPAMHPMAPKTVSLPTRLSILALLLGIIP
ncbi:MAG: hypothetical protein V4696_13620 [Pseudomonadota bacterium]